MTNSMRQCRHAAARLRGYPGLRSAVHRLHQEPRHLRGLEVHASCVAIQRKDIAISQQTGLKCDVVLSSGFLAFANHSGFLQAVEEAGIQVSGVMGTSAGAIAGSLYCAGYTPQQVAAELSRDVPITLLRCSATPWKGFLSLEPVIDRLRELLPPRFEDLQTEFAVGVVGSDGEYMVVDSGPLPEAVVASAAIPVLFESVSIPGMASSNPCVDGGVVDRVGLKAWRDRRRAQYAARMGNGNGNGNGNGHHHAHIPPALVHVIARSSPFSGFDDVETQQEPDVTIFHSPKSGVNFFSLGDFDAQLQASMARARPRLAQTFRLGSRAASTHFPQVANLDTSLHAEPILDNGVPIMAVSNGVNGHSVNGYQHGTNGSSIAHGTADVTSNSSLTGTGQRSL